MVGQNVTPVEIEWYFGAHQNNLNYDRPKLLTAYYRPMTLVLEV